MPRRAETCKSKNSTSFGNKGPRRSQHGFDVVVTGTFHPERFGAPLLWQVQEQFLTVPERNDFVLCPVDNKDGAVNVGCVIDIREFVSRTW